MRRLGVFGVGAVLLVFCWALPAHANLAQRHILDASINMGWATETLARDGRAATTIGDVARAMELAQAHIRALVDELRAPYGDLDFSVVLQRLADWDRATAGSDAAAAARYVQQTYDRFRETLTVYFDARTQGLVRDSNCDVFFAEVGFHFGRAHISALRADAAAREGHLGNMRQAIRGGLQQDQLKLCGFGVPADWNLLPVLAGDVSANGFGVTLPYLQEIALQAQGGAGRAVLPPLIARGGYFIWQRVGDGDCPGRDVDSTPGFVPDASLAGRALTAVCWDADRYRNHNQPGVAFCTYKNIEAAQCVGGDNIGARYQAIWITR
jgi:hypothetical protein